jgi:hypothetical protein
MAPGTTRLNDSFDGKSERRMSGDVVDHEEARVGRQRVDGRRDEIVDRRTR